MSELNRKLRWLIALRLLIVVSIVVPYFLYRASLSKEAGEATAQLAATTPENRTLQLLIAVTSLQTLAFVTLLRLLRRHPVVHAYLQFASDLLLVTLLVYRLGGSFSILYLVIISVASVLLRRSTGLIVAGLAFALYALVVFSPSLPWVRSLGPPVGEPLDAGAQAYTLLVHLIGFCGVALLTSYLARDVTLAEALLRAKKLDLASLEVVHRDVVQSIASGVVTTDLAGVVISVNRSGEQILGRSSAELVGIHLARSGLLTEAEWGEHTQRLEGDGLRSELECTGDPGFVGVTLSHLRDGRGERQGYLVVLQDLTEQRRMQEELRIKDRMAAIGEMAAGLAHEIGNPLTAISGSVQVLGRSLAGDAAQHKLLDIILKESQRLDRTVKAFLQLTSSRLPAPVEFDVAALLAEDVELLRHSDDLGTNHRIEADLVPQSVIIRADPDRIGQIFWNLSRNALQAMPAGGTLEVSGRLDGELYRIRFRDTGSGMTEEERTKMFQPFKSFFDRGTGIGMAIVYRIVAEHDGTIRAESEPGRGTTISVELPIAGPKKNNDQVRL